MIKPTGDRILVLPDKPEEKTKGGLFIPQEAQELPLKGIIKAVGPGTKDIEMKLKPNTTILFRRIAGEELEYKGIMYRIMKQSDVFAII